MTRRIIIIAASIVLVLSAAAILIAYFTGAINRAMTNDMFEAGEKFMRATRNEDYDTIVNIVAPDLLEEIGPTGQTMQDNINSGDLRPVNWEFTNRKVVGTQGQLSGSVVFSRGRQGIVELSLSRIGREWRVSGFRLEEN